MRVRMGAYAVRGRMRGMRRVIKRKSDCKFCEDAIVLNQECTKVIAHYKCAIDNEDMSDGCHPGLCNYYEREKESEVK